jgi:organic radical activating enzyme/TusA-related sulfurtransferase
MSVGSHRANMTSPLPTRMEIASSRTFANGLLLELIAAVRATRPGDLVALTGDAALRDDLEAWCRMTGHALVGATPDGTATRWVIRHGAVAPEAQEAPPLGSRIWLYTNFDCNLRCDYCCIRSSPLTPRRGIGLDRVRRIAAEAAELRVQEFFVTGGEPFLLPDIADIVAACAAAAPTTVLTNAMLFRGKRLAALQALPRDRVTLQVSLDSPDATLHDSHRGAGAWAAARAGIEVARAEGFRVRFAATISTDEEERRFAEFLDLAQVASGDRVIRRVALRGFAGQGLALSRADLLPELTITAGGVYYHPIGADDEDLLVTREISPLATALEAVRRAFEEERQHASRLASVYHCA